MQIPGTSTNHFWMERGTTSSEPVRAAVKPRILLVEDDPDVRSTLADILSLEGYDVEATDDGDSAMALLKDGDEPDVILLDLMMPRMNGWQFRALQETDPKLARIPVVVLSAQGSLTHEQTERLHAAAFLRKPIEVPQLVEALSHSLVH
jgi:CheY-like chemotaxis protein